MSERKEIHPNDERMLDIVGFDANIPVMIEEFISN